MPKNMPPLTFEDAATQILAKTGVAQPDFEVTIAENTTARFRRVGHNDPQMIVLRLYSTDIVQLTDERGVYLNTGGFPTMTTLRRFNAVLNPFGLRCAKRGSTLSIVNKRGETVKEFTTSVLIEDATEIAL